MFIKNKLMKANDRFVCSSDEDSGPSASDSCFDEIKIIDHGISGYADPIQLIKQSENQFKDPNSDMTLHFATAYGFWALAKDFQITNTFCYAQADDECPTQASELFSCFSGGRWTPKKSLKIEGIFISNKS